MFASEIDWMSRKNSRRQEYESNLGFVRVRCGACNGSGYYDGGRPGTKCGCCGGTGKMRVKRDEI